MSNEPSINTGASVQLCTNCEKIALKDDCPAFQVVHDEHGKPHHVFTAPDTWMETDFQGEDKFPDLPGLLESSLQGCTFCAFFKEILSSDQALAVFNRDIHPAPLDSPIPIRYQVSFAWNCTNTNEDQYLVLQASFPSENVNLDLFCTIQALDECRELASWLSLSAPTHDSYANQETVEWMRSRLDHCCENHSCGADLLEREYLPDRLLDVQKDIPKLVLRDDITVSCQKTPNYLALSYCWGTNEDASHQPKLTKDTLQQFQTGIDEQHLSVVHRDAVFVAKALSIPYLWIDSLCILQDDDDRIDWQRQCEQMDKIYGCAHVTLLAAASGSCRQSFLRRSHGVQTIIPFRSAIQSTQNGLLHIELRKVTTVPTDNGKIQTLFDDIFFSRLSRRGWAYQERILSRRKILFGEWNFHYMCPTANQSLKGSERMGPYERSPGQIKQQLSKGYNYGEWVEIFELASMFGGQSFTYPEDILPALSGLARLVQNDAHDVYLAGHWAQDLFRSLAWRRPLLTHTPKEVHFRRTFGPGPYTVPSWSILYKVFGDLDNPYQTGPSDVKSEMESCVGQVALVGTDPFGAIKNAHLEIRSRCFQNRIDQSIAIKQILYATWKNRWSVVIDWDSRRFYCGICLDYHLRVADINQNPKMWRWVLLGSVQIQTILNTQTTSTDNDGEPERYPYGLLLLQVPDRREWYRAGVFEPNVAGFKKELELAGDPELELMTLGVFKEMSEIETITVI
ncbi:hypothetical protein PFICI_01308 [Pestalotiopsis fici W106-1]|uniref:Heterokaryon incompatibility domain-containing protein n=1 Tax=Pestalotiopsis fici (strain W106-1 / CGMCC3.15140) TaxID=1229662 RepID=W3XNF3_PESFW|nr:uncharacterized protein PFICI_01308 [Pestalotiopsis fici W106-1]ETS87480.1 hypothetical protein PFICI_01308 [Pestalotiopsis fici W106-1]